VPEEAEKLFLILITLTGLENRILFLEFPNTTKVCYLDHQATIFGPLGNEVLNKTATQQSVTNKFKIFLKKRMSL
jgi:hypothetical protein